MKRTSLLLALLLLLSCCLMPAPGARANEAKEHYSGDYSYTLDGDGNATITGFGGNEPKVTVPAVLDGHPVRAIGDSAFSLKRKLTSVTLPEGLLSIGDRSFSLCEKLTSVTLPDSLVSIGPNPFIMTPATFVLSPHHPVFALIDGVLYEKAAKKLLVYPFGNTQADFVIPDGIQAIADLAFGSASLESLTLPESLVSIGDSAFADTSAVISLSPDHPYFALMNGALLDKAEMKLLYYPSSSQETSYDVPVGTRVIGSLVFQNWSSLTAINLPEGLTSIEDAAFQSCGALNALTLPESVTDIGEWAFSYCNSLTTLTLPKSLLSIGDYAFEGCERLTLEVHADSWAEGWAKANDIPYKYVESGSLDWLND